MLYGTHFAGFKPWNVRRLKTLACYARFPDYRRWFAEYVDLVRRAHPALLRLKRLRKLLKMVEGFI